MSPYENSFILNPSKSLDYNNKKNPNIFLLKINILYLHGNKFIFLRIA